MIKLLNVLVVIICSFMLVGLIEADSTIPTALVLIYVISVFTMFAQFIHEEVHNA